MNIHLPGKGWRQRIGEEGVEWLLTETIEAGKRGGLVKDSDLKRVIVDTTVMEKNIAHPTDARLYETARRKLVGLAREAGIGLRQNYNRLAPRLLGQVGRYAHARQFKRMRKALRRLKGYTGRVLRDIERQLDKVPEGALKARMMEMIALVHRLLAQKVARQRACSYYRTVCRCSATVTAFWQAALSTSCVQTRSMTGKTPNCWKTS